MSFLSPVGRSPPATSCGQPPPPAMEAQATEYPFRSFSFSSSSTRSEESINVGYHPPVSEYEEIPSLRWLSASFFTSKPTPSPPPPPGGAAAIKTRYPELALFQTHVADHLHSLVRDEGGERRPLVSLSFLRRLLEAFVFIEEEFKAALLVVLDLDPALVRRAPVGRLVADLLDRVASSLDVCSAVSQALDSLQFCQRYVEIAASALHPALEASAPPREARFRRARKALSNVLAVFGPDQSCRPQAAVKERGWLFGRSSSGGAASNGDLGSSDTAVSRFGRWSLSLNMSRNWSAAKQVDAMWASFAPPRGADATALAMAVYAMSAVMVLVVWTLVLAFPYQGQGGHALSAVATGTARALAPPWQAPMVALQERIAEECRRNRMGSSGGRAPSLGLLAELQSLVRCGSAVVEVGGGATGTPVEEGQWEAVGELGRELAATCGAIEEQLGPLQRQLRAVFRRVLLSRAELLGCLGRDGSETLFSSVNR